jgi:hypothetical protein
MTEWQPSQLQLQATNEERKVCFCSPSLPLPHVSTSPLYRHAVQEKVCCCWCCQISCLTPQDPQKCDLESHQQGAHMAGKLLPGNPVSSLCLHVQKILSIIHPDDSQNVTRCQLDSKNTASKGPPAHARTCQKLEHRLPRGMACLRVQEKKQPYSTLNAFAMMTGFLDPSLFITL